MRRRHFASPLIVLAALLAAAPPLHAQPFAKNVPDNALVYIAWRGADAMAKEYDQSHFKAVMAASSLPRIIEQQLPVLIDGGVAEGKADAGLRLAALLARPAWRYPTAFVIGELRGEGPNPKPAMAVICDAGAETEALAKKVEDLAKGMTAPALTVWRVNTMLVIGIDGGVDFEPSPRAQPPRPRLADSKDFQAVVARLGTDPAVVAYVDVAALVKAYEARLRPDSPDAREWATLRDIVGLAGLKHAGFSYGFDGPDWAVRGYLHAPGGTADGLLGLLANAAPVSDDLLKLVPASAPWLAAGRFDAGRAYALVHGVVAKNHPDAVQNFDRDIARASKEMGADLVKDVIEPLGDEWVTYAAPDVAGTGVLGTVIINRARDGAKLEAGLSALERFLNKMMANEPGAAARVQFAQTKAGDLTLHYLAIPAVGPTWAVKDGNLYLGLYPQAVIGAVEQAAGKGGRILDAPAFVAARKRAGGERANALMFADLPRTAADTYPLMLAIDRVYAGILSATGTEPVEGMTIPPLNRLMPHLSPLAIAASKDADGWAYRRICPFPGSEGLATQLHALTGQGQQLNLIPVVLPALAKARAQARSVACMANLRQVTMGLIMYQTDKKGFLPDDLGQLVTGKYMPVGQVFRCPAAGAAAEAPPQDPETLAAWVKAHATYVYLGNGRVKVTRVARPSEVVIVHEPLDGAAAHGGMVNLAFLDGHVELVPLEQARQVVAQSKLRLEEAARKGQ